MKKKIQKGTELILKKQKQKNIQVQNKFSKNYFLSKIYETHFISYKIIIYIYIYLKKQEINK